MTKPTQAQTGPFKVESGVALVSEKEFEDFRNVTIERCAQVAKQHEGTTKQCVAAIRALKK